MKQINEHSAGSKYINKQLEANKQTIINISRDLTVAEDKLNEVATRLSAAEATWEMAENLYRQLADQVREHAYDIKDLNR